MKEGEGRIEIKDFPHEVIEACLRFMYSGRLNVQRRLLVEVAAFRDKYAISELKDLAKRALAQVRSIGVPSIACLKWLKNSLPCYSSLGSELFRPDPPPIGAQRSAESPCLHIRKYS